MNLFKSVYDKSDTLNRFLQRMEPDALQLLCNNYTVRKSIILLTIEPFLDLSDTDDHQIHKRKRRRKKKVSLITTAKVSTPPAEGAVQGQTDAVHASNEGHAGSSLSTERLSKNRKRKMKKKRHKEKLVALGLVPHVRAVEFTYAQSGHGNLEEVLDLLRTTQEIYLSDRKSSGNAFYCIFLSLFSILRINTLYCSKFWSW